MKIILPKVQVGVRRTKQSIRGVSRSATQSSGSHSAVCPPWAHRPREHPETSEARLGPRIKGGTVRKTIPSRNRPHGSGCFVLCGFFWDPFAADILYIADTFCKMPLGTVGSWHMCMNLQTEQQSSTDSMNPCAYLLISTRLLFAETRTTLYEAAKHVL